MRSATTHSWAIVIALLSPVAASSLAAKEPRPFGEVLRDRPEKWKFVAAFSDEFEGPNIDLQKWNIDTEDWGAWSWEPENAFQRDGSLHLQMVQETHKRGMNALEYKSGIARSHGTLTYGYFEARVRGCSRYPGACPAFWLHSKGQGHRYDAEDGETVVYSEIDVVELQQCEWNPKTRKHFEVNHIDCNLHAVLLKNGRREWVRPHQYPGMCKNEYDAAWDPREDYHVYAMENTEKWVIWYIDGKEIARKPNLYWHLPMHVTLSLGLRYPFVAYKNDAMVPVPEKTTAEGFPTSMSVDYVRVWRNCQARLEKQPSKKETATDMTKEEFVSMEKAKWAANGWAWNHAKVESNFDEIDTNQDGIASGQERQLWYATKAASMKE